MQNSEDDGPSLTTINLHFLHNLWLPDVEILDLKAFETHSVLSKLEGNSEKKKTFCTNTLKREVIDKDVHGLLKQIRGDRTEQFNLY